MLAEELRSTSFREPNVASLMTREVLTLTPEHTMRDVGELLDWRRIRHIPVVDADQRLLGLITQRDFLGVSISKLAGISQEERDQVNAGIRVGSIMGRKVKTVLPDASLSEAAAIMHRHRYGCLPVVNEAGQLAGIITEADFVRAFLEWRVLFGDDGYSS